MPSKKVKKAGALVHSTKGALTLDVARSGGRAASELCFGRLKKELKAYTEASDHAGVRRLERLAIKVFEASNVLADSVPPTSPFRTYAHSMLLGEIYLTSDRNGEAAREGLAGHAGGA